MKNEEFSDEPKVEVRVTGDGSSTLYVPALDEHYHSTHGAVQEAQHVYISAGLAPALATAQAAVRVLEVGFGTGLNALLTLQHSLVAPVGIHYDTVEKYPLSPAIIGQLGLERYVLNPELLAFHERLHAAPWNETVPLTARFSLRKIHGALQEATFLPDHYHVIYFDAFAPEKQPELWTEAVFAKLYAAAAPGAVLVSYCAQGQFRRNLRSAG